MTTNSTSHVSLKDLPQQTVTETVYIDSPSTHSDHQHAATASLLNPHLQSLSDDVWYHLGMASSSISSILTEPIKYVLVCGSADRATEIGRLCAEAFHTDVKPIGKKERYSIYTAGPCLISSHGMGCPSFSILLHEVAKVLVHIKAVDPIIIRIGTSGGVGVEPGTVVISSGTVNGLLQPHYDLHMLSKIVRRESKIDQQLVAAIRQSAANSNIPISIGKTLSAEGFYELQGRLDGAICMYSEADKMQFLQQAHDIGVLNIEMEANYAAAFCNKLNIRFACICVALLNRLNGDQVTSTPQQLAAYQHNAIQVAINFIMQDWKQHHAQ